MMRKLAPLVALSLLGGCVAPAYVSPVEVTRFASAEAVLAGGTISIAAAPGTDSTTAEYAAFADALAQQLTLLGFRVMDEGGAQVAQLALGQSVRSPERRSPVNVGGGASVGGYGSGVGLGIGLDLTPQARDAVETRLMLSIRPASGGSNLWEGRASMSATANSDYTAPEALAARMAGALLEGFPGNSGETITIP